MYCSAVSISYHTWMVARCIDSDITPYSKEFDFHESFQEFLQFFDSN